MGMFWGCLITFPKVTVTNALLSTISVHGFCKWNVRELCIYTWLEILTAAQLRKVTAFANIFVWLYMPLTQDNTTDSECRTVLRPNSQVNEYIYEFKMFSVVLLFYFVWNWSVQYVFDEVICCLGETLKMPRIRNRFYGMCNITLRVFFK